MLSLFKLSLTIVLSCFAFIPANANVQNNISKLYSKKSSHVEKLYKDFHMYPELSGKEFKTSKRLAKELRNLGYKVTENVGGTGLVAILKNGQGPTVWLRADMDGLPVQEETKKTYASKNKGVMHACGHDVHMASMVGYAHVLQKIKDQWSGTLVLIGQPAEETVSGAKAMLKDGLYKRFPKPDYVLGLHVSGHAPSGEIRYTKGYALAAVDSIDITVKGVGGHGAFPQGTIDPVVLASKLVVNIQTLVSRNIDPRKPVVLSFGSIHGGTKHNIIPNTVHLQGTLRTYSKDVRKKMLDGIKRVSKGLAMAEGAPEPEIKISESTPTTYNDIQLTERLVPVFQKYLGEKKVASQPRIMGAEDFSYYSLDGKIPTFFYFVGGTPKDQTNYGPNHNSKFAPDYKQALKVGVESMAMAVINLAKPISKKP